MSDYRTNSTSYAARSYGQQYTSYTSSSMSYSGSDGTGQQYTKTVAATAKDDGHGTTVERRVDETGKPTVVEKMVRPAGSVGRRVEEAERGRIEDVTETEHDERYQEAMEDEYAKREGGA